MEVELQTQTVYIGENSFVLPEENEGYLETISFDEETQTTQFYTTQQTDKEVVLNHEFFTQRGIDLNQFANMLSSSGLENLLAKINDPLLTLFLSQQNIGKKEPLKHVAKTRTVKGTSTQSDKNRSPYVVAQDQLVGARALLQYDAKFHNRPEVLQSLKFIRNSYTIEDKAANKVAAYLDLVGDKDYGRYLVANNQRLMDTLVIKAEDVPNSYFENQIRLAKEQGYGEKALSNQDKQSLVSILREDQKKSLVVWLDYLSVSRYPAWYQYLVVEDLKKLGAYDNQTGRYSKRRRGYVGAFPELNREALALSYEAMNSFQNNNVENMNKELLELLKTGGFKGLYEYFLKMEKEVCFDKNVVEGEWQIFTQTEDEETYDYDEEAKQLSESLQGWNTGWCTAGEETAQTQLQGGDFFVYYSKDNTGKERVPRLAIRMEDDYVAEVRGIESNQNVEGIMTPKLKEKLKDLPGGDEYFKKVDDMKRLTDISQKDANSLEKKDLRFLYEIDGEIQGFGYQADPRIKDILQKRADQQADVAHVLGLKKRQVRLGDFVAKSQADIEELSYVQGELSISGADTVRIKSDSLKAKRIKFENSGIAQLPNKLEAEEISFYGCNNLKTLSQNIVADTLIIWRSGIQSLPDNLKVKGLSVNSCPEFKTLPKGLVAKNVDTINSGLKSIPKDLKVEKLNVSLCKDLESIPAISAQSVNASGSGVSSVSSGLFVDVLNVSDCLSLKTLSKGLKIKHITANKSGLETLPEEMSVVSLRIEDCQNLKTLPKNSIKLVYANNSSLETIKECSNLHTLEIQRCANIKTLPLNFKADRIAAIKSGLAVLPEGLHVETLEVGHCKNLKSLPKDYYIGRLWDKESGLQPEKTLDQIIYRREHFDNYPGM